MTAMIEVRTYRAIPGSRETILAALRSRAIPAHREIGMKILHFAGLRRLIPGISQKVLTEQLRELEADEIVDRNSTGPVPAPVHYSLTEYGRSLVPLVDATRQWGRGHIERFS